MEHTGIDGSTSVLELENITSERDLLKFNFPVRLLANGNIGDGAGIGRAINTTEDSLATIFLRVAQPEGKHGGVKKALVHHLEERRSDVVDRDGVVGKAENSIEPKKLNQNIFDVGS